MIFYSFIPILSIYAGWRIQKFWVLLGINVVLSIGVSLAVGEAFSCLNNPYIGTIVSMAIQIPISVLVVRHFASKYNYEITAGSSPQ